MGAVIDDFERALTRSFATKVCNTLLRNDDIHIVFRVVDMRAHGHNSGNLAVFGNRRRIENGQVRVAGKVTAAADTIHHLGPRDMGGVYVAVDVHFDSRIHGDNTKAVHHFRAVGNLFRTQQQVFLILGNILIEAGHTLWRRAESRTGSNQKFAGIDKVEHTVLNNFGVNRQILEVRINETCHYSIGYITYTRLQRQQVLRHAAGFHFLLEEVQRELAHLA